MKSFKYISIICLLVLHGLASAASDATTKKGDASAQSQINTVQADKVRVKAKDGTIASLTKDDRSIIVNIDRDKDMPWLGQSIVTLFGFVISAFMIIWQMKRQHKIGILLQKENMREVLRLKIYQTLDKQINKVIDAVISATTYLVFLPTDIENNAYSLSKGVKPSPLKQRAKDYTSKHQKISESIGNLFRAFGSYEIACPNFMIFKIALDSAKHDLQNVHRKLFNELLEILPIDVDEETSVKTGVRILDKPLPNEERCQKLKALIDQYNNSSHDILSYMHDLRVDAQNTLLDKLFDYKLAPRTPTDTKYKVITTEPENIKELKKYFENETAWGKYMKKFTEKKRESDLG